VNPLWLAAAAVVVTLVGGSIGAYDASRDRYLELNAKPSRLHNFAVSVAIAGMAGFAAAVLWSVGILLGALGVWLMGLGR
jgi:uncharacterized membrane protein